VRVMPFLLILTGERLSTRCPFSRISPLSAFKNPVISKEQFLQLKTGYESVPNYPAGPDRIKVPAAWLIEQAGWKGAREGDVGTWPLQPLVIVNYGTATGKEIFAFSEKIRQSIAEKFSIGLEREVTVIGN